MNYRKHVEQIIDELSLIKDIHIHVYGKDISNISLKDQFAASTHTFEGYSIKEHSIKAMIQAYDQKEFYPITDILPYEIFEIILALHDIGKDLAHQYTGTKRNQHAYTIAIIEEVFKRKHQEQYTKLMKALLFMDAIGELLKGQMNRDKAYELIKHNADHSTVTYQQFFCLLKYYYICDASAYENLMINVFVRTPNGQIVIRPDHAWIKDLLWIEERMI